MDWIKSWIAALLVFILRRVRRFALCLAYKTGQMVVPSDILTDIETGEWEQAEVKLIFAQRIWGNDPAILQAWALLHQIEGLVSNDDMASDANHSPTMARNDVDRGG